MAFSLTFCGPKFSICCMLISVWGLIMLPIMGVLLKQKSLTFAEDLVEDLDKLAETDLEEFYKQADERYENAALTCFIAGAIYLGSLAVSGWQAYLNFRH